MKTTYLINSIYRAIEGEGIFVGTPQVFVRFQGCAVGCLNCDSKDTWEFADVYNTSLENILNKVHSESGIYPNKLSRVSITGGDPLHPKHVPAVLELAQELKKAGFTINLEAAGTRIVDSIFDTVDFISFDFKTPSTGVTTNPELIVKLVNQYPNKFQIKAVIADEADFHAAVNAYEWVRAKTNFVPLTWCLTPAYDTGANFPQELFEKVLLMNLNFGQHFRVIGQQHKWVFGSSQKQC